MHTQLLRSRDILNSPILQAFWQDEGGFIVSAELVLVGTLSVVGMVAGLSHLRGAVNDELIDIGDSLTSLNQSYSYSGFRGCKSFTAGSSFAEEGTEVVDFPEIYVAPQPCHVQERIIETPSLPAPCHECLPAPCQDCLPTPCENCQPTPVRQPDCCPTVIPETNCCPTEIHTDQVIIKSDKVVLQAPANSQNAPCPTLPTTTSPAPCGSQLSATYGEYIPAPIYQGVYDKYRVPDDPRLHSIYNTRRYIDSPYQPVAPLYAPRSSVW